MAEEQTTSMLTLSVLELKKHRDTDSPFSIRQDANDNWKEIEEWSAEVKQAISDFEGNIGELTPEKIREIVREVLLNSKRFYTIPKNMLHGESVTLPDGTVMTRDQNQYIFTISDASKYFVSVQRVDNSNEIHPSVDKSATEIRIYFDSQITTDVRVMLF